ncbi:M23 family metallopeptidase [Pseudomonas fluorescens]|uniref:M23 family metallopeptidase n=1 Tax=Pseudomonas fluorescens TaxID=294 RepID=UPI0011CD3BE3|nr:M23 family metallopeptidase [Pseudomonas fluorescens]
MIIGPPFIPAPVAGETDKSFLDRAMVGGVPGDGGYPLSFDLNWHGGIHLKAPQEGGAVLPVRVVSDGKLAYFRKPTPESSASPDHALRYRDKWTDDGCVVIRHETEVGEGENGKIVFYSIYMHLSAISIPNPQKGMVLYRKDVIGEAGSIYGEQNRIHFEIVADQAYITKILGRSERELNYQSANGRSDSCWGDVHFFVPPEVHIYENAPADRTQAQNTSPVIYRCPAMPSGPTPIQEGGSPPTSSSSPILADGYDWAMASELQEGIFVQLAYNKGQCTLTSYTHSGFEIGSENEEADYEHNLFKKAKSIYSRAPSAGYELLRFGRVLGPDQLLPAEAAHWRRIKFPGKAGEQPRSGWVNLNSPTVTKFSDADFPHWKGWKLIDDDTDSDSHCQSSYIRGLLNLDAGKVVDDSVDAVSIASSPKYAELSDEQKKDLSERYVMEREINKGKLQDEVFQEKIKRTICKFPSEWCKNDFDARYGWLLKVGDGGPLPQDKYDKLKAHQQALGFWEEAGLEGISNKHWHFPPRLFVEIFRKCAWLSLDEFAYTLPKYHFYERIGSNWVAHTAGSPSVYQISHAVAKSRFENYYVNMNKTMLRYGLVSVERRTHFLAQTILETDRWRTLSEYGSGNPNPHIPMAQYYAAFYGRGIMQLTWAGNYEKYGDYRAAALPAAGGQYADARITATSTHYWADPTQRNSAGAIIGVVGVPKRWAPRYDPTVIKTSSHNACDSGGFYWVSKVVNRSQDLNINRSCDAALSAAAVGSVSVLVNGGGNGYHERQAYAQYVFRYLSDSLATSTTETITTPRDTVVVNFSMSRP